MAHGFWRTVVYGLSLVLSAATWAQNTYEVHLPADINSAPDLCALVPCQEVLPEATSFSKRQGRPTYVEGFKDEGGQKKRVGYVMLSTDITDTPAYSGKPVVTLIGMDTAGKFVGVKILKHSEPILLLGIPESALIKFNNQYIGHSVGENIEIGRSRPAEQIVGLDAITGATVTVIAQNQVMMMSGTAVARQVGILAPTVREQARFIPSGQTHSFAQLEQKELVKTIRVSAEQVGLPPGAGPYIELKYGYLNYPDVGRAVLGAQNYENLMQRLKPDEHAIFMIRTAGGESFKGSGFVRGGIYDRVQVRQGGDSFTFRDSDYLNLYSVQAAGAPTYSESAIFVIRSTAFSAAYPWRMIFLGNTLDKSTGARTFVNFDSEYWLPAALLEGGRPAMPDPMWLKIWKSRSLEIGLFTLLLTGVAVAYAMRDALTRRATRKNKWAVNGIKYVAWAASIFWVGGNLLAQPSITQVLTWFHAILFQWQWALFLSDPFIFIFWIFIVITVFIWGRGLFCGWLCPFGSLSEGLYKLMRAVGGKRFQFEVPQLWHHRLKWLKYLIFFGLLCVSLFSMELAERLAEVEPFKTTFLVGLIQRSQGGIPYVMYATLLLGLSLLTERPFCKYLCPLGAALAMPTTFRWFGLQRKAECTHCTACAKGCGSHAIDADGRIDQRECMLCLDCMILYTDTHACPPLAHERKRREKAGEPLTPIGRNGYYIPIHPVAAAPKTEGASQ